MASDGKPKNSYRFELVVDGEEVESQDAVPEAEIGDLVAHATEHVENMEHALNVHVSVEGQP